MRITDIRAGSVWKDKKYADYAACQKCTVLSVSYEAEEVVVDYNGGRRYRLSEFVALWGLCPRNDACLKLRSPALK